MPCRRDHPSRSGECSGSTSKVNPSPFQTLLVSELQSVLLVNWSLAVTRAADILRTSTVLPINTMKTELAFWRGCCRFCSSGRNIVSTCGGSRFCNSTACSAPASGLRAELPWDGVPCPCGSFGADVAKAGPGEVAGEGQGAFGCGTVEQCPAHRDGAGGVKVEGE